MADEDIDEREIARTARIRISELKVFNGQKKFYTQFFNSIRSIFNEIPDRSLINRVDLIRRIANDKLQPDIFFAIDMNEINDVDSFKRALDAIVYRAKSIVETLTEISKEKRKKHEDIYDFAFRIKLRKNDLISAYTEAGNTEEYANTNSDLELRKAFILGLNPIQQALCVKKVNLLTIDDCLNYIKSSSFLFDSDQTSRDDSDSSSSFSSSSSSSSPTRDLSSHLGKITFNDGKKKRLRKQKYEESYPCSGERDFNKYKQSRSQDHNSYHRQLFSNAPRHKFHHQQQAYENFDRHRFYQSPHEFDDKSMQQYQNNYYQSQFHQRQAEENQDDTQSSPSSTDLSPQNY